MVDRHASHGRPEAQTPRESRVSSSLFLCFCVSVVVFAAACAPKTPPALVGPPKHPEFMFPAMPEGTSPAFATRVERGWQYLQLGDLRNAEREFSASVKQQPSSPPGQTAMAYLAMARGNDEDAATRFERALQADDAYVPALVGRGQALLRLERDGEALASFEAALTRDPSLVDLRGRIDLLRFRATQDMLARARAAADIQGWDAARAAYLDALSASPESPFLYRELAGVEQKLEQITEALGHYRQAVELDPFDARSLAAIGAILEDQGDLPGAVSAYERARTIDPDEVPASTLARARARAAMAEMPPQYRAIPSSPAASRADVAAIIGVRLEALVARARSRQLIITDVRGHWAQPWISAVVRAGVMDTLPNYQFQPDDRIRRGDLALIVSQVLTLVAAEKPQLAARWQGTLITVNDVPPAHLSYPAVSAAVASGVMPLVDGSFDLLRVVTGAEAFAIVGLLEGLAQP